MIRIIDFRPLDVSRALPGSSDGNGCRQIWQFDRFNGPGGDHLAKVEGKIHRVGPSS